MDELPYLWDEGCICSRKPIGKFTKKEIEENFPKDKIEWVNKKVAILKS
jgi:hypothetical protein